MGYKINEFPYTLRIGRDLRSSPNLFQTVKDHEQGYDFIMVNAFHN